MLVRTQSAIVLPIVLLAAWLAIKNPRIALRGSLLLLAGVALAVTPWLWRNWRLTGGLVFDNPASQTMVLAQRYSGLNFEDVIPYLPGETDSQYSQRMLQIALDGIRRDPAQALHSMANHFLNNEIDNVLLLPLRSDLPEPARAVAAHPPLLAGLERPAHPRPGGPAGGLPGLLGLGLAACWRTAGWAGLLPLGINLGYNCGRASSAASGERFLVPVDWTATLYFAAGLVTLSGGLLLLLSRTRQGMLDYLVYHPDPHPRRSAVPRAQSSGGEGVQTPSPTACGRGESWGEGLCFSLPRPDHPRPWRQPAPRRTHLPPALPSHQPRSAPDSPGDHACAVPRPVWTLPPSMPCLRHTRRAGPARPRHLPALLRRR